MRAVWYCISQRKAVNGKDFINSMNVSDKVKICCVGERENERVNEWNEMSVI